MKYYEYKASGDNILLDLDNFSYKDAVCSKYEQILIEVTKEDGKYFNAKYIKEYEALEGDEEKITTLKNLIKEELVFKGYDLNNLVEPIIHN